MFAVQKIAEKAIVKIFRKGVPSVRFGRGFSMTEVRQAGILNYQFARSKGIFIDTFRTSSYPENVEKLSKIFDNARANVKPKTGAKGKSRSRKSATKAEDTTKGTSPKKEPVARKKRASIGKIVRRKRKE